MRLKLHDQPFRVLSLLLIHPGELVAREEIQKALWPSGTFVDFESGLNSAVNRLRDALGDSAEQPKFIETVPRRGYRFILPVEQVNDNALPQPQAAPTVPEPDIKRRRWLTVWIAGALAAGAVTYFLFTAALPSLSRSRARSQIRSVFVVLSGKEGRDSESQILTESAGEAVLRTLRRAPNLKVITEHSPVTRQEALSTSRALKCDGVLFVRGERAGDRFRIQVETIDSNSGTSLWQETVTGRVSDAIWVDVSASELVARRFEVSDVHVQRQQANEGAFREYVRGRFFWNKRNPRDLQEAFASFRGAIHDDPGFSPAYAGLAQTYAVAELHDPVYRDNQEFFREARDAAERAVAMDPSSASAHAALAQILRNHDRDMAAAEREYLKALDLDPTDATARQWYAEFLALNGRFDEAIAQIDRAHELDPLSAVITAVCGTIRIWEQHYAESLPFAYEALRLDPHYYSIYSNVATAMEGQGRYLEAFDAWAKQAEEAGDPAMRASASEDRAAFLRGGRPAMVRERLNRSLAQNPPSHRQYYVIARLYCQLGEVAECLNALERAVGERGETVTGIKIDPSFDIIRDDPRFTTLVAKFGFRPAIGPTGS